MNTTVRFAVGPKAVVNDETVRRFGLVWLPGSGQAPDNELLRRFVNALFETLPSSVGIDVLGVSCHQVDDAIATLSGLAVVVGGHSMGGTIAHTCGNKKGVLGTLSIGVSPSSVPHSIPHAALVIIGENDPAYRVQNRIVFKDGSLGFTAVHQRELESKLTVVLAKDGDHSIRWFPRSAIDKEAASVTPETKAMNLEVAHHVHLFFASLVEHLE
ncbi:unnamed protein product [Didymodactylos carnosus]|uniref:Alpha/beta hydrolase n=1 Tax=Didymodactylos carnosus TaxID=1234261 RepID=A0A8S2PRB2_9BILA|nr:unnamed protein product [Didymodactylos carnosus]CAF4065996.1 unnamed protein product [Didymodactylos carnosus]